MACFCLITLESVYTGIKITGLVRTSTTVAVALCASIFCMNVEFALLKTLVRNLISEKGISFPAIHEHPLFYVGKVSLAFCSICRERIGPKTDGYEAFVCKMCEDGGGGGKGMGKGGSGFTLCLLCYRKQMVRQDVQEGILRGDKGPKHLPEFTTWDYMRRTVRLAAPFKLNFIAAIFCILVSTLSSVLLPNQQGAIINSLVAADEGRFTRVLSRYITLSVVSALFSSFMSLTINIVARQIMLGIRADMFKSLVRQDMAFFDGIMTGQLTSRMTNDVNSVTQPIQQVMGILFANIIKLGGGTFMCFYTSWKLTMLALTMIGPVMYITGVYAQWSRNINLSVRASMGDANATATESLRNIRTVRSFGAAAIETTVFEGHLAQAWSNMRKDAFASAGVAAISGYVSFAAGVLVYWYGGKAVLSGSDAQLDIGGLITFNMYWNMLGTSIAALNGMLNSLVVAASAAKRVYEIVDLEPDIQTDDRQALPLESVVPVGQAPAIELIDVYFTYQMRPDKQVFSGLSFTIPAGSTAAFVGKSGCGKSTTMQLLMRFYDPQQGQVLVAGTPLTEYNLRSYQRRIAVVSQETQIFARSVKDNLTYGMQPEEYTDDMIETAARQANAHEFIMQMDRGYDSMLGESGSRLSGGQKQRLSIARAFLRRPQLLFLDEATSALDSENEKQIQAALDDMVAAMSGSVSVVIIAHRLSTIMNADKIIVINEGLVFEQGSHAELMKNDGIYASLVKKQMAKDIENNETTPIEGYQALKGAKGKKGKKGKEGKGTGDPAALGTEDAVAPGEARDFKGWRSGMEGKGKGKWKGQGRWHEGPGGVWKRLEELAPEERRDWLRKKMQTVLQRALRGFGSSEVSDAMVFCIKDAIDNHYTDASSQAEGKEDAPDNIAMLFREVSRKAGTMYRTE